MKIAIISDVHLGRRSLRKTWPESNINAIEYEGYLQWKRVINEVASSDADALLVAGDLFHSSNPTSLALENAISGISTFNESGKKAIIIGGNHDSSLSNEIAKTHPFKNTGIFKNDNCSLVYDKIEFFDFDDCFIVAFPHFNISEENSKEKFDELVRETNLKIKRVKKKKIFLSHGVTKSWIQRFINKDDDNIGVVFEDDFLNQFDYVVLGHIHEPFIQKVNNGIFKCKRIVPGSLMEDNTKVPAVLYLDTESGDIARKEFETIRVVKKNIDSVSDLENFLGEVAFNIYFIKFNGQWKDIDLKLYNIAVKKALYLNIQISSAERESKNVSSIQNFWDWVKSNCPQYTSEFKNIVKEEK